MPATRRMEFRITDDELEALNAMAKVTGQTRTAILRSALRNYLRLPSPERRPLSRSAVRATRMTETTPRASEPYLILDSVEHEDADVDDTIASSEEEMVEMEDTSIDDGVCRHLHIRAGTSYCEDCKSDTPGVRTMGEVFPESELRRLSMLPKATQWERRQPRPALRQPRMPDRDRIYP